MSLKVGSLVRVLKNTSRHNYKIGEIYVIDSYNATDNLYTLKSREGLVFYEWISLDEMEIYSFSKKDILYSINKCEMEISKLKDMISYMESNNIELFDNLDYLSYKVLDITINDKLSLKEKTQLILEKIKN